MLKSQEALKQITEMTGVNPRKCMRCGKCTATCPAFDEMDIHPHQFVALVEAGRIGELANTKGIYHCLSCFACVERCPRQVEPAALIEAVRDLVEREAGMNYIHAEEIPAAVNEELPAQALVSAFRKYKK